MNEVEGLPAKERGRAMLCIMLGLAMSNLASAVVNIALPEMSRSLAVSDAATVWVVNAYQLAATVCLLPISAMGETLGLKRVYAAGLMIFTLASLGCALAPSLAALVGARLLQGAGAACISVAGVALVRLIYPHHMIAKGLALVALSVAVPAALGPTVAAMILAVATWPWLFLVNVPVGALAMLLFLKAAPPEVRTARRFDLTGSVLNALAFGFLVVGVGALGLGDSRLGVAEIVAGLVCFGLFFRQQAAHAAPMVPFDLLRIPAFVLATGTSICSYSAQILAYVSLPFLFEKTLHLSTVSTGLLVTPWPLTTAIAAPIAGRLATHRPASVLCGIGLALLAAGLMLMVFLPAAPSYLDIIWRLALCGAGFGLFQTPNNTAMMTAGPIGRSSAASGMNAIARYVGWTLGSALVALIFAVNGASAAISCLIAGAGFAALGAIASIARRFDGG